MGNTCVMKPTAKLSWTPLVLLFIYTQMFYSLIVFHGEFINSSKALISPFNFCLVGQDGGLSCDGQPSYTNSTASGIIILRLMVILGLYAPLVLVAFALLALLFAACCEDREVLWLSVVCQAGSSLLTLLGLSVFVGLYWSYVRLADMTVWYYICVGVHAELAVTTMLTVTSGRRLMVTGNELVAAQRKLS